MPTLFDAAKSGDLETLTTFIGDTIDINAKNESDETALTIASNYLHLSCVKALIQAGADVNIPNDTETPLSAAILGDCFNFNDSDAGLECVEVLLSAGANPNLAWDDHLTTPLQVAADSGHPNCIRALLKAGADRAITDDEGTTPLAATLTMNQEECITALLEVPYNTTLNPARYLSEFHPSDRPRVIQSFEEKDRSNLFNQSTQIIAELLYTTRTKYHVSSEVALALVKPECFALLQLTKLNSSYISLIPMDIILFALLPFVLGSVVNPTIREITLTAWLREPIISALQSFIDKHHIPMDEEILHGSGGRNVSRYREHLSADESILKARALIQRLKMITSLMALKNVLIEENNQIQAFVANSINPLATTYAKIVEKCNKELVSTTSNMNSTPQLSNVAERTEQQSQITTTNAPPFSLLFSQQNAVFNADNELNTPKTAVDAAASANTDDNDGSKSTLSSQFTL